jgi:hypothetical protein
LRDATATASEYAHLVVDRNRNLESGRNDIVDIIDVVASKSQSLEMFIAFKDSRGWRTQTMLRDVRDADFQGIARAAMSPEICLTFLNVRDTDHDLSKPGKNDEMRRLTAQQKHR